MVMKNLLTLKSSFKPKTCRYIQHEQHTVWQKGHLLSRTVKGFSSVPIVLIYWLLYLDSILKDD